MHQHAMFLLASWVKRVPRPQPIFKARRPRPAGDSRSSHSTRFGFGVRSAQGTIAAFPSAAWYRASNQPSASPFARCSRAIARAHSRSRDIGRRSYHYDDRSHALRSTRAYRKTPADRRVIFRLDEKSPVAAGIADVIGHTRQPFQRLNRSDWPRGPLSVAAPVSVRPSSRWVADVL
jgi:hypothetical protein